MAKSKLTAITIRPTKGGGHKVTHEFAAAPKYSGPSNSGGMAMDQAAPAEHSFAPGEHNALLKHIAGALALKGLPTERPGAGAGPPANGPGAGLTPGM